MVDESKTTRTTISVPRPLKEQMDAVAEPVNWSALACRAFEGKLAELAAKKERKDMQDVITRLRASKQRVDDEQYHAGEQAGREWTEAEADADELQNLDRWVERLGHDIETIFADQRWDNAYTSAEDVAFTVWPEHDGDRGMANAFWEERLGDDTSAAENARFVRGFVDGALDVWHKVKDQL
jgi:hypothetical protein